MTKSEQIRKLLHLTNAEISRRTGFLQDYVRAVRQRTTANGEPATSRAERTYRLANPEQQRAYKQRYNEKRRARYYSDPEYRERQREKSRQSFRRWYYRRKAEAHA